MTKRIIFVATHTIKREMLSLNTNPIFPVEIAFFCNFLYFIHRTITICSVFRKSAKINSTNLCYSISPTVQTCVCLTHCLVSGCTRTFSPIAMVWAAEQTIAEQESVARKSMICVFFCLFLSFFSLLSCDIFPSANKTCNILHLWQN